MATSETKFERRVYVQGGHDWRGAPNYGIGCVRFWFYVVGPKGAVQWQIGTDWYPDTAREHLKERGWPTEYDFRDAMRPKGLDLGYHAKEPQYDSQSPMSDCSVIGNTCYYDGSGLNADLLIEGFIHGGTDWLWPKLEAYYSHVFEGAEWPDFAAEPRTAP